MRSTVDSYLRYLLSRAATLNLTAIKTLEEARVRHGEDCAALLGCAAFAGKRVLDVGSGAGLPGLIIKLIEPGALVTLLEATSKKARFLLDCCRDLGIDGVEVVCARAEDYARTPARESFDIVAARGVAALPALCELCLPFARVGGLFLAMKQSGEETAPFHLYGGARLDDYRYTITGGISHTVIRAEKTSPCPEKYPRPWRAIRRGKP
ncbi:MAG: 16S rRNA (guanine(527)-N(7))-methyltransferase RsmG [Oscillospiraceae bacterium]|nr:16S rRNA (guanine(527)-N(7))-methyltransferase RsmG [Oscillospiraceae bacterium]